MKQVILKYPNVPERTIRQRAKSQKLNKPIQKPGPKPVFGNQIEDDLEKWIIAMQSQGFPVSRHMVLMKANKIYKIMHEGKGTIKYLSDGWLNRFMERHSALTLRSSQAIQQNRNEATLSGITFFLMGYSSML